MTDWNLEVAKLRARQAYGRKKYGLHLRAKHQKSLKSKGSHRPAPRPQLPPARALDILRRWDRDYDADFHARRGKLKHGQHQYLDDVMTLTRRTLKPCLFIDVSDAIEARIDQMAALLADMSKIG